jgi:ribosomal protein S18 acetylase RimI-like enzyme
MAAAIALGDGLRMQTVSSDIVIRPLARTDRERLADAFGRLSEDTRRRRFGGLASGLGQRDLDRLTDIDHHAHEAFAAVAPDSDRILGVARYIALADEPEAAEVAVAVDDEWQGRGIGRRLMRELVDRAHDEGITCLLAYVGVENRPVLGWLERAGGLVRARDGEAIVVALRIARRQAGCVELCTTPAVTPAPPERSVP